MISPLLQLTDSEWEDICDGCGRCCVVKLQDEDTEEIVYTNIACEFLDVETCRCMDYRNRGSIKPECVVLDRQNLDVLAQMPFTCAYRLVHENRSISRAMQNPATRSVGGRVVSEKYVHEDQIPEHIVDWITVD